MAYYYKGILLCLMTYYYVQCHIISITYYFVQWHIITMAYWYVQSHIISTGTGVTTNVNTVQYSRGQLYSYDYIQYFTEYTIYDCPLHYTVYSG